MCGRAYHRAAYRAQVEQHGGTVRPQRAHAKISAYVHVLDHLKASACVDCGEHDIRVLQFDHVDPTTKHGNIADLCRTISWEQLQCEMGKCVVRCGNCHRRKTLRERELARVARAPLAEAEGFWRESPWRIIDAGR